MPLINTSELGTLEKGDTTYAEVKIHFQTDFGPWLVSRKMEGEKDSLGKLWFSKSKQTVTRRVGNKDRIYKGDGTKRLINNLLPDALNSFFFIDGEQLREFFRISSPQKVADAIDTVSQLGLVYNAFAHLGLLEKDLRKSIKATTPQLDEVVKRIEFVEGQISQLRDRRNNVKKDLENDTEALSKVKEYLSGHSVEKIRALEEKRQMLEAEKGRLTSSNDDAKLMRNQYLVDIAPFIFLKEPIERTYALINERVERGELPPKIKETFVHELIEEGRCICGTDLSSDSEATSTLLDYSKHLSLSELSEVAIVGKTTLEEIQSEILDFPERIDAMTERIDQEETRLEQIAIDIEQIKEDLRGLDLEEINRYEARREQLTTLINQHELLLAELDEQLAASRRILLEHKRTEHTELAKHKKYDTLRLKLSLLRETQNVLAKTQQIIKGRIREKVEQKTNENFLELIRKEGAFKKVTIDDDYTVKVLHSHGFNVINDLSAGEYMILGLAFMSALMSISGFHAPVIIDTPLAKIDDIHRKYITTELPLFLKGTQLVLLVTPTEYDKKVQSNLSEYLLPTNCCHIEENETYTISEVKCKNA
jgi:DNA sulfur modification protein DndD